MTKNAQRGYTLAETLVALVVGMTMLLAIYSVVNMAQQSTTGIERKVVAHQDARVALEIMSLEIRMASYNSSGKNSIWVNPSTCIAESATVTSRGIRDATRDATRDTLTVVMDINDDGNLYDDKNEIIKYEYLPAEQRITREAIRCATSGPSSGGAQPFLGSPPTETSPGSVHVINGDPSLNLPLFRYYDGQGNELFPTAADQTMVKDIRRISITIAVETAEVDPATNKPRRLIYGTSVIPKNHAISY